jgi:chromosome segregation ATPase
MSVPLHAPAMTVQLDGIPRSFTDESSESFASSSPHRRSKSPGRKLGSFFGWKSSSPNLEPHSPATSFSDVSASPAHSRNTSHIDATPTNMGLTPPALDFHSHHRDGSQSQYFDLANPQSRFSSSTINAHVEDLERELKQVSSELAGSIRREMELEDEIDRFRSEMPAGSSDIGRRTSDYFSDSGTSSLRYPLVDSEAKIDELERLKRKAEQEKAQMQVDYAQKLSDEMKLRKSLETQVQQLEGQLYQNKDGAPVEEGHKDERVRELEVFLDETRRRLSQERQSKDNFEDLFAALKDESEKHRNERDNLRDEVVPELKARVEGLEAEAAEMQSLRYENTGMQQQLQALRAEVQMLQEAQDRDSGFNDDVFAPPRFPKAGLSRSNSLARPSSNSNLRRSNSLARSGSVREPSETRQRSDSSSGDRHKDLEDQRDALHQALKNLLRRYEGQKQEHAKTLRKLTTDRDRARKETTGRTPFTREVNLVRYEIGELRKRADDALEQKWQCESNIGGVKMALDRAQQETQSMREYLNGRTVSGSSRKSTFEGLGIEIADENVELGEEDRKTMIKVLRQSIALAETERDAALREAEEYRQKAHLLQQSEDEAMDTQDDLAHQLLEAATRMEQLASQVEEHLQANMRLRERLSQAVGKGEQSQSESTALIVGMQSRLKLMEDNVVAAQQLSELALVNHEEEAKQIDDANSPKLQRLNVAGKTAVSSLQASPLFGVKSPKIGTTSGSMAENLFEASKTATLERRVKELEAALIEADSEMQSVVQRINSSQFEIAELQGERYVPAECHVHMASKLTL